MSTPNVDPARTATSGSLPKEGLDVRRAPRYDEATLHAEARLAQAEAEHEQGDPIRAGLPGFFRRMSLARLVRDRDDGLHHVYRYGYGGRVCTCGLVIAGKSAALDQGGHLDASGQPVDLLLGYGTQGLGTGQPNYRAVCQRCGWVLRTDRLFAARNALQAHVREGCAVAAGED